MVSSLQKDIVILGTGGFAKEVFFLLQENNKIKKEWNILGFVDDKATVGTEIMKEYCVVGNDNWLQNYPNEMHVVCGVANTIVKEKIVTKFAANSNLVFPVIISHSAKCSDLLKIGKGTVICAGNILTVNITIGEFVTINLDCTVGHDVCVESYVTIYPGVHVSGNVTIGSHAEIGTGTQIIQGVSIGEKAILGAGCVVIKDIPSDCTAVGNPARIVKQNR